LTEPFTSSPAVPKKSIHADVARVRNIIFDLDGTPADSMPGILASLRHTVRELGLNCVDSSVYGRFIGPPLAESFRNILHLSETESVRAVGIYRGHYSVHGIIDSIAYTGIPDALARLAGMDVRFFIASAKLTRFASGLVHHLGLSGYFERVCGSTPDNSVTSKAEILRHLLDTEPRIVPGETIMVGDMDLDVIGARANGIRSIAVLYGYGNRDDILASEPDFTAETVSELVSVLVSITAPRS